jgi:hypothetical protein
MMTLPPDNPREQRFLALNGSARTQSSFRVMTVNNTASEVTDRRFRINWPSPWRSVCSRIEWVSTPHRRRPAAVRVHDGDPVGPYGVLRDAFYGTPVRPARAKLGPPTTPVVAGAGQPPRMAPKRHRKSIMKLGSADPGREVAGRRGDNDDPRASGGT